VLLSFINTDGVWFTSKYIYIIDTLPLNNPDTMTVNTVNKLTTVNTLLIIVDSRTPHDNITVKVISIK